METNVDQERSIRIQAPDVKWLDEEHRKKTDNQEQVMTFFQGVVSEAWERLPPSAQTVIDAHPGWNNEVYLMNTSFDEGPPAKHSEGEIQLNVYAFEYFHENVKTFHAGSMFRVAHELAHVFWQLIGMLSQQSLALVAMQKYEAMKRASEPADGQDTPTENADSEFKMDTALYMAVGLGHAPPIIDILDGDFYESSRCERLADALAIAWGFGNEYIDVLGLGGMTYENDLDLPIHGLEREVLRMILHANQP